jgi:uncharacterized protein (DUF3820 family)
MLVYVIRKTDSLAIKSIHSSKISAEDEIKENRADYMINEYEVINADTKFKSISETQERVYEPKHMSSYMPFGKYQGKRIDEIIEDDPKYIQWAIDNLNFSIDEECQEFLQEMLTMKGTK